MYASKRACLLGSSSELFVVPFAIVDSLLFCPCGDCGHDRDALCTGLLTIVGMRDGRHVGSDDVTR